MSFQFVLRRIDAQPDPIQYCIDRYKLTRKRFWRTEAVRRGACDDRREYDYEDNNPYDR